MSLTYNIQEAMEVQRDEEARKAGVPERDIDLSRRCGIDARDVRTFREESTKGLLLVVRCPKTSARAWHGLIPPKPISFKDPSGPSGVAGLPQHSKDNQLLSSADTERNQPAQSLKMYVSDYDLMSLWRHGGQGWRKIFASAAHGRQRGPYPGEATLILKQLNKRLVSRIMHGCQDDYCSQDNRGVKPGDHFTAFCDGRGEYLPTVAVCKSFYERNKLPWLYSETGAYLLDTARRELERA